MLFKVLKPRFMRPLKSFCKLLANTVVFCSVGACLVDSEPCSQL